MKEKLGKEADELKKKKLFLVDMDGTIYRENELFEGTLTFLDKIKKQGGRYIFLTNNSSKSVDEYTNKLYRMGIIATHEDFYISSQAAVEYLKKNYFKKKSILSRY